VDFVQTVLDVLALLVCLVMAYYALQVLLVMRKGLLENSWKYIAGGTFVIALGVVIFSIPSNSAIITSVLGYLGTSCQVIGALFLIICFRSLHPKKMLRKMEKEKTETSARLAS
jgi:uncharacterized membrane protein HdeD (DUF308 family)